MMGKSKLFGVAGGLAGTGPEQSTTSYLDAAYDLGDDIDVG